MKTRRDIIKYDFETFKPINKSKQNLSCYYLNGFQKYLARLPNNHYILLPGYEDHDDIQYSGVTGTGRKGESPLKTARRELYEEVGLKAHFENIRYLGKYVCYDKKTGDYQQTNYFYYVDINDCRPITTENIQNYKLPNKTGDTKRIKVTIFVVGKYQKICSTIENIKETIDDGDGITYTAVMKVGYVKKIHRYNKKYVRKRKGLFIIGNVDVHL